MLKIYFKNSKGEETFIADIKEFSEFFDIMTADIHKRNPNYKVPYTRIWCSDDHTITVDVGSHSEFYKLKSTKATRYIYDYIADEKEGE